MVLFLKRTTSLFVYISALAKHSIEYMSNNFLKNYIDCGYEPYQTGLPSIVFVLFKSPCKVENTQI